MILTQYGENAMFIQFEQRIDENTHAKVMNLYHWIIQKKWEAVRFCIPAYCSLTVGFDAFLTDFQTLQNKILSNFPIEQKNQYFQKSSTFLIPVCYEKPYALDMEDVCQITQLSAQEIIRLHTSSVFRVYMLGFVMGFPYLGTLPQALYCVRKSIPLLRVPAQSVAIAGNQTGIYPMEISGGWQIIGRTPVPIFDASVSPHFLFQAGDSVRFYPISMQEFEKITSDLSKGIISKEIFYAQ